MAAPTSEDELVEQLKRVPLFGGTSVRQRRNLANVGTVLQWDEGSTPIAAGSKGAAFFLILEGSVQVQRDGRVVARLSGGDFVGEIALLTDAPRNADVTALADTVVFALGRDALAAALEHDTEMSITLLEALANRQSSIQ